MLTWHAVDCCKHLGNEKRFAILCALVDAGSRGLSLSQLSNRTKSSRGVVRRHMQQLDTSGLVRMKRDGRMVRCTANVKRLNDLVLFLAGKLGSGPVAATNAAGSSNDQSPALFSSLRERLEMFDDEQSPVAGAAKPAGSLSEALSGAGPADPFDGPDIRLTRRKRA